MQYIEATIRLSETRRLVGDQPVYRVLSWEYDEMEDDYAWMGCGEITQSTITGQWFHRRPIQHGWTSTVDGADGAAYALLAALR